ncbi:MAG: hypothetical protein J6V40_05960 [Clostridia bacterium]|nr:hypothetical protein [Clostridia bacterium]
MSNRQKCVVLIAIHIVLLFVLFMPANTSYGFIPDFIISTLNVLYVIMELFTIFFVLWMIYDDNYKYISIVEYVVFVSLIISLVTVYVFALISINIAFKYVLLNFALIIINILDFIMENINKVIKYNRNKLNDTKDT